MNEKKFTKEEAKQIVEEVKELDDDTTVLISEEELMRKFGICPDCG